MRAQVLSTGLRVDGRKPADVRAISIDTTVLRNTCPLPSISVRARRVMPVSGCAVTDTPRATRMAASVVRMTPIMRQVGGRWRLVG